jgi:transcriptional regulator with XRE-family HTH domain
MAEKEKINRIKLVLVEKEITQKDFAGRLGITPNTLYRYCKNESQPSLKLLRKMAIILGINIHDLLIPTPDKSK